MNTRPSNLRRYIRLTALLLAFAGGCGLFDVRDSQAPLAPADDDPLDFLGLLRGTSETFTRLEYAELFAPAFVFQEGAGALRARSEFISRLSAIERTYPSIHIEWTRSKVPVLSRVQGYVALLDSVTYRVYLAGDRTATADYTGYADIELVYIGYWAFSRWYDFPEYGTARFSFFNPDFTVQ